MNIMSTYFLGKLLIAVDEAKIIQKSANENKDTAITIRITNPTDGVDGCSKHLITVLINVCSAKDFSLSSYYSKKILIPSVKGITEELLIPFVERVLESKPIAKVTNFMDAKPHTEIANRSHIFVLPNIYTMDNTIFTFPKNDFSYLPVVEEANTRAKIANDNFVSELLELQQLLQEEPNVNLDKNSRKKGQK